MTRQLDAMAKVLLSQNRPRARVPSRLVSSEVREGVGDDGVVRRWMSADEFLSSVADAEAEIDANKNRGFRELCMGIMEQAPE